MVPARTATAAPYAGRDPGAARPGGRPRIPAQPFGIAGHPGPATPDTTGSSPWQRSHQLWSEAGIQWEQRPAAPQRQYQRPAAADWPAPADADWPERMPVPLGAPVFSDQGVDEDDGPDRDDRWGDDRPPIWERPAGLVPQRSEASRTRANDTLLVDHRMPGSQRSGRGLLSRRTATIAVPAIVLVAVAVLALALLTGHGPTFGPLTANQHRTPNVVAPRLSLGAVTFDTYPGQQQRGVFQTINRVVAAGNTIVTMGSQTSDGVVRQQFLVSTNAGASWQLAPIRAPGGGQAAPGHQAALLAGGRAAGWRSARKPSGPARAAWPGPSPPPTGSARSCPATPFGWSPRPLAASWPRAPDRRTTPVAARRRR